MKLTKESIEMIIPKDEMFQEEAISTIFDRVEKEFKFSKSQLFQAKEPNPLLMRLYNMDVNSVATAVLVPVFGLCLVALVAFPGPKSSEKTSRTLPTAEEVPTNPVRYSFPKVERGADLPSGLIDFRELLGHL
jgi:hypothetical protein